MCARGFVLNIWLISRTFIKAQLWCSLSCPWPVYHHNCCYNESLLLCAHHTIWSHTFSFLAIVVVPYFWQCGSTNTICRGAVAPVGCSPPPYWRVAVPYFWQCYARRHSHNQPLSPYLLTPFHTSMLYNCQMVRGCPRHKSSSAVFSNLPDLD